MNSKISKTFDSHRLILNISDKTNLKTSDKHATLENLSIYDAWKNKSHVKTIVFKHQLQRRMINSNCLMDRILYQIFRIILSISSTEDCHLINILTYYLLLLVQVLLAIFETFVNKFIFIN